MCVCVRVSILRYGAVSLVSPQSHEDEIASVSTVTFQDADQEPSVASAHGSGWLVGFQVGTFWWGVKMKTKGND